MKLIYLFFAGAFWACKSRPATPPVPEQAADQPWVTLETTPCRGFCAAYKISIQTNGKAEYEGLRFVRQMGRSAFTLQPAEINTLRQKLTAVNLWQYPETFPTTIADAPGAILTVYNGEQSHTVRGALERPQPIKELQTLIEQIAQNYGYNLESLDPNALPDDAQKREMVVELKPDVNAGNWLRDFNQNNNTKLLLVRRLGAPNHWVIAFDAAQFKAEQVKKQLQSDANVTAVR